MAKKKKQVICLLLTSLLLLCISLTAFAAQGDVSVVIDGVAIQFTDDSGRPFIDENNRTQVPLRVVMEKYGCHVEWDSSNRSAVITKNGTTVVVPIGESYITVNGSKVVIDTAAQIRDNRTYLPIRAVLEAFGADVAWDNGTVMISSPSDNAFENIYINKNGELIFVLANGNEINAGKVPGGKDGRDGYDGADGISVKSAYVDASGNLMIELSNGRKVNAGNVGVGGAASGLTFADYPVGTKFYLTLPSGSFTALVGTEENPYTVEYDSIYYELTAKRDISDPDAWRYYNHEWNYCPFEVTVHISGKTESHYGGKYLYTFLYTEDNTGWQFISEIMEDGSFSESCIIGETQNQTAGTFFNGSSKVWYAPKTLFYTGAFISGHPSSPYRKDGSFIE